MYRKLYQTLGLGGTFDHFHQGHEHFLTFANSLAEYLVIGITDQKLTKQKPFAHSIDTFSQRQNAVRAFCHRQKIRHEIVKLTDLYGPTLTDGPIEALCVTEETTQGARAINEMRQKLRLDPLPVHVATMLQDQTGQVVSSARIRAGEVSRSGLVYGTVLQQPLTLTDEQRQFFAQRQGELATRPSVVEQALLASYHTCVVGDTTLEKFIKNKWHFSLGVYDLKQQRKAFVSPYLEPLQPDLSLINPAGTITQELVTILRKALASPKGGQLIYVEGEEDLATVALVLMLSLHSKIYYGQPGEGMVELLVTEEVKDRFYKVLATRN